MAHTSHISRLFRLVIVTVSIGIAATPTIAIALSDYPPPARAQDVVPCLLGGEYPVILPDGTRSTTVVSDFDPPAHDWLPGHRGLDIAAPPGSVLIAPTLATVSFAGSVGGKNVVSVTLKNGLIMSFEPIETPLKKGDILTAGAVIGTISGHSDHCDDQCVHWGARRNGLYINPPTALKPSPIVLKHVEQP